jgi:hypothetical protein
MKNYKKKNKFSNLQINLNSNLFSTILYVLDAPKGRLQVLFQHQKQYNPPLVGML